MSSSSSSSSSGSPPRPSDSWHHSPQGLRTNSSSPACYWPSYGNSSNSPMAHKFSGMGLRDVFNVTLAQEMSSLGMANYAPLDL